MTLIEMNKLINVHTVDTHDFARRRDEILVRVGSTYDELLAKEDTYSLTKTESAALLELRNLDFLIGE
ncbi:MAG: hypothetical protein ACTHXA_08960 [Gulosibacter sp.]|uniref:hypothetical protein n=1 Tax=Gulosibacter sp. TaxID=2817531 RepID=UPI003F901A2A